MGRGVHTHNTTRQRLHPNLPFTLFSPPYRQARTKHAPEDGWKRGRTHGLSPRAPHPDVFHSLPHRPDSEVVGFSCLQILLLHARAPYPPHLLPSDCPLLAHVDGVRRCLLHRLPGQGDTPCCPAHLFPRGRHSLHGRGESVEEGGSLERQPIHFVAGADAEAVGAGVREVSLSDHVALHCGARSWNFGKGREASMERRGKESRGEIDR